MDRLLALIGFAFVSSVTPGPNNVLLWASGATFGWRRTIPHVVGTALGLGAMALAVAAGLGALIQQLPGLAVAMKVVGSVYLLYLALQIARAHGQAQTDIAKPLGIERAAAFQVINPKAWIFALGAVTTFRPPDLPFLLGSLLVAGTMMIVILPSAGLWAVAGGTLNRLLTDDRRRRIVSTILAVLVVASVASVWL